MQLRSSFNTVLIAFLIIITGVVIAQSLTVPDVKIHKPKPNKECIGEPINVDYPYYGNMIEPHACKPQCKDKKQHYILYTNGKGTQCQILPGCLDWGEDQGVACVVPDAK